MTEVQPGMGTPTQTSNYSIMIASGVVLAILVIGGLFFWGKSVTPSEQLTVEEGAPVKFEIMTSHVSEPNMSEEEIEQANKAASQIQENATQE